MSDPFLSPNPQAGRRANPIEVRRPMKALGVAQRLAGMKERFEKRLDAVLAKAEQAEARGEAGIQRQEAYVNNLERDIAEMEQVMAALDNGAPDPSETQSEGS